MKIDEKLIIEVIDKAAIDPRRIHYTTGTEAVLRAFFAVMRERREEVLRGIIEAVAPQYGLPPKRETCPALHQDAERIFDHLFPENPQ